MRQILGLTCNVGEIPGKPQRTSLRLSRVLGYTLLNQAEALLHWDGGLPQIGLVAFQLMEYSFIGRC